MGKIIICSRGDYPASERIYSNLKKRFGNERILWAKDRISLEKILSSEKIDYIIFAFWSTLIPDYIINNYKCISFHAGDLPKDRGGSPLTWQILEGKNKVPITLFEASDKVDSGAVYYKDYFELEGHELIDEMRKKQAKKTFELVLRFLNDYPDAKGVEQSGDETSYRKRTPKDSELDVNKSIKDQFNLLRVVDNERYPAFFKYKGKKYIVKIYKGVDK